MWTGSASTLPPRWPVRSTTSTAVGLLRTRAARPDREPGQAHRRALGPGPGGYQVGNFPPQWTEWNGKYRDTVRDFWRGRRQPWRVRLPVDRFGRSLRTHRAAAVASVNFVTAHDGFTLRDLVSYNEKHNEANGEDSNDGESNNESWNAARRGPPTIPRSMHCVAASSAISSPPFCFRRRAMISHGDELGRTQGGNNNGYCQDNEITWIDWARVDTALLEFTRTVSRCGPRTPCSGPSILRRTSGSPSRRRGDARHLLVPADGSR